MRPKQPPSLNLRKRSLEQRLPVFFKTSPVVMLGWLLLAMALWQPLLVQAKSALPKVGMTVGQAHLLASQGQRKPLVAGMELPPGSHIQTGADAVVVLVFPDNARVSLRADSELIVHRYTLDPSGQDTRMELELVRGAMRQISGNAARSQPERFRLNTPVAAIGVRGTDFLAQTQGETLQAFVHEGAIEVAPRECSNLACAPVLLVSNSLQGAYLHIHQQQVERRHIPLQEVESLFGIGVLSRRNTSGPVVAQAPAGNTLNSKPSAAGSNNTTAGTVATSSSTSGEAQDLGVAQNLSAVLVPQLFNSGSEPLPDAQFFKQVSQIQPTPDVAPPPTPEQLVWGRFGSDPRTLSYQLLQPYALASQGRHVTVGLLGQYGLWRQGENGELNPTLSGVTHFRLASGEAYLHEAQGISPAQINQAKLSVDFGARTFATTLYVTHSLVGLQVFDHTGRINAEGLFNARSATDLLGGAVTRDGKEAGLLFARTLPQGNLQGVTLWGGP